MNSKWTLLFVAWIVALVATAGSLFFSEVMQLPPCSLCWYQRIAMYPLVLLLLRGLFPLDMSVVKWALPQTLVGWGIAFYHNLLYYQVLPESAAPCRQGISCTAIHIQWLGFITIPLLSLIAFTLLAALLLWLRKDSMHE